MGIIASSLSTEFSTVQQFAAAVESSVLTEINNAVQPVRDRLSALESKVSTLEARISTVEAKLGR